MVLLFGWNRQIELNSALVSTSTATAQIQVPRETGLPHNLLPKAEHNYVSLPWTLGLPKCKKDRLSSGTFHFAMITYKVPMQD